MDTKKILLLSAAVAGLSMTANSADKMAKKHHKNMKKGEKVMCYGVNSCKGHGKCAGVIKNTCNGKNGCQTEVKCMGMNSCKGKGLVPMSKKDCLAKKGTVAKAKM